MIRATKGDYVGNVWNLGVFETSDENQNKFIFITLRFVYVCKLIFILQLIKRLTLSKVTLGETDSPVHMSNIVH